MSDPSMNHYEAWCGLLFILVALTEMLVDGLQWKDSTLFFIGMTLIHGRLSYTNGYNRAKVEDLND